MTTCSSSKWHDTLNKLSGKALGCNRSHGVRGCAYVLITDTGPSGNPTFTNLGCAGNAVSNYQTLAARNYDVDFVAFGTTQIVYTASPVPLSASQNRTMVLLKECQSNGICTIPLLKHKTTFD